jgi:glycosyltransferase involved in cell wall biosynthesis
MRIGYWCGWLDPEMVAVSKEVFQLMDYFPRSCAFGVAPSHTFTLSVRRRAIGIHHSVYPIFRPIVPFIERRFDVSHVYTSLGDWHHLRTLGQRPIVLTLTQRSAPTAPELLEKVRVVAAESSRLASEAIEAGIPEERVTVVYPGVDLTRFAPAEPPPSTPWRMLFASSPETPEEVETKGLGLLLDLAARQDNLELTILWRPFGAASTRALMEVEQRGLENVRIVHGRVSNIETYFAKCHFVVAPFRTVGKPCPNSILEGLASGRPALVSDFVDISELLDKQGAGVRFSPSSAGLEEAFRRMCAEYHTLQANARPCAERYFDLEGTRRSYENIYRKLLLTPARRLTAAS